MAASAHTRNGIGRDRSAVAPNLAAVAALVLVTALVYAPVLDHGFVPFDDPEYIVDNPRVHGGLTAEGIRSAFTAFHLGNWHPLTWMSHMLDVELFGLDAGAHHAVGVALHAASAVVLFAALRAMTGARWPSLLVAALFALHPLRVESVAWASERKDVLGGLFWMLTLLAWARYARRPSAATYAPALVALALGLLAKPMLVTLPLVLLLLDFWPLGRWGREDVRPVTEKLPMLALCAASAVVTVLAQRSAGAVQALDRIPLAERAANAALSAVVYVGKTIWPTGLAFYYPHPALVDPEGRAGRFVLAAACAAALALLTVLALRFRTRWPHVTVGWLWYLVTLVPVIGIVQVGTQSMADRYTYVPGIGLALAVSWSLARAVRARPAARSVAVGAVAVALATLAGATRAQVAWWSDGETLFRRAIAVTEDNFVAHTNLGWELHVEGDDAGAERHLRAALAIRPDAVPHNSLGVVLAERGDLEAALAHFREAVRLDPAYVKARYNLALALDRLGHTGEAIEAYRDTLAVDPDHAAARGRLDRLLADPG